MRSKWSQNEDDLLQRLVQKHGPKNWSFISKSIPGRSVKSCRLRWCKYLSPEVNHGDFSPEEDETIIQAYAQFGKKWATIASLLKGRTNVAIKNHWKTTLKPKCRTSTRDLGANGGSYGNLQEKNTTEVNESTQLDQNSVIDNCGGYKAEVVLVKEKEEEEEDDEYMKEVWSCMEEVIPVKEKEEEEEEEFMREVWSYMED